MPERIIAGRYEVLDMCGKGGTAQVFLVRRRRDQKLFAAKVIHAGMPFTSDLIFCKSNQSEEDLYYETSVVYQYILKEMLQFLYELQHFLI